MIATSNQTLHMNCTQCGAGLDVLGGGRVKTHICSYCGAELDAQEDYKVIQQFRDMPRPETPFDLGMTGKLWGVDFTIIGTIAWAEYFDGKRWSWVDHQIYSPTHGYAWLTIDNGYVTYSRKTRDIPTPPALSHAVIETSDTRPHVRFQNEVFSYYSSGKTSPTFIEGAFNFRPQMDDVVNYVELMGGARMLGILESGRPEREYEISELPDQANLLDSFGVEPGRRPRPRGTHPLDTIERTPIQSFTRNLALAGAAAALVIGIGLSAVGEKVAQSGRPRVQDGITLPFEITTNTGLTQITLYANATNSWAWFEAELTDANDEPVAEFERGIEYYTGSDWSEGSRTARTRLTLEPGEYTLFLSMVEGEQDYGAGNVVSVMSAEVHQGVANPLWMWIVASLLGLIGFLFLGQRFLHSSARWSGSDWSDE